MEPSDQAASGGRLASNSASPHAQDSRTEHQRKQNEQSDLRQRGHLDELQLRFDRAQIDRRADDPRKAALIGRGRARDGGIAGIDHRAARERLMRQGRTAVARERPEMGVDSDQVVGAYQN